MVCLNFWNWFWHLLSLSNSIPPLGYLSISATKPSFYIWVWCIVGWVLLEISWLRCFELRKGWRFAGSALEAHSCGACHDWRSVGGGKQEPGWCMMVISYCHSLRSVMTWQGQVWQRDIRTCSDGLRYKTHLLWFGALGCMPVAKLNASVRNTNLWESHLDKWEEFLSDLVLRA